MPIIETRGSLSSQGYGQFAQSAAPAPAAAYIEDVFSTWLYTGNNSTQTITNGIDLATKGGLVWIKRRSAADSNWLFDTNRGMTFSSASYVSSNSTLQQFSDVNVMRADATGFSWGSNSNTSAFNGSGTYASWTFAKQPKFFDVVTYTGDGLNNRVISHNLGATPGFIIIKSLSNASNWVVYHRSIPSDVLFLERTDAAIAGGVFYVTATSNTTFTIGRPGGGNASGQSYVAYLFAHNAGGFGASGTDNVISCGSFTTDGSGNATVNLGWEPQWVLTKPVSGASNMDWRIVDNMRGITVDSGSPVLIPNTSGAEFTSGTFKYSINGFRSEGLVNSTAVIYIAIRRGPMRTPTSGTSVFVPQSPNASGSFPCVVSNFPVDMGIVRTNKTAAGNNFISNRLAGQTYLYTNSTVAEAADTSFQWDSNTGWLNLAGANLASWNFRRAPGFFDVVCYTGTGVARTVAHNLGVAPELMLIKVRTPGGYAWRVYAAPLGVTQSLILNSNAASETDIYWNGTVPTATVFSVNNYSQVNNSGSPIVAYLFASCPGVSKVGFYTGTGSTVQVNCGFTAGARFVLIKRIDDVGDWYVWDSARGIVAANDPYLLLNSTAAEVTSTDWVDTLATGFEVSNAGSNLVNVNGGTYIFLAIA